MNIFNIKYMTTNSLNKFWLSLAVIFLLFTACNIQNKGQKIEWKEFVSEEGKFKILFPGIPRKSVREIDTPNGKVKNYISDVTLGNDYFAVMYSDFPDAPVMNQDELKANYDAISNYTLNKSQESTLIREQDIGLNGKLGRELIVDSKGINLRYRFFLIENRMFQIVTGVNISVKNDVKTQERINKFLDSFQVIEKKPS